MKDSDKKIRVLFLCTGNSCRSQMAEGWARYLMPDKIEAYSAGTKKRVLDSLAVQAMAEVGVDISGQKSKTGGSCQTLNLIMLSLFAIMHTRLAPYFPAKRRSFITVLMIPQGWRRMPFPQRKPVDITSGCGTRFVHLSNHCRNQF